MPATIAPDLAAAFTPVAPAHQQLHLQQPHLSLCTSSTDSPPTTTAPAAATPVLSTPVIATSTSPTDAQPSAAAPPVNTTPVLATSASPLSTSTQQHSLPSAAPPSPIKHHMVTRAQNNIHKPVRKLNLHTSLHQSADIEPTTVTQALKESCWRQAMAEECNALINNGTWELVQPNPSTNVIGCKWIFRIKRKSDGTIDRYKARLVAKGFNQRPGVDYFETFSPVIKPTTVRLVLSIATSHGWPLRQLDINNAFLQGQLTEDVYMAQPPGFIDSDYPTHVCKLRKAIYGLKQAPRAWYHELRQFLITSGFTNSYADTSLFVLKTGGALLYLLIYVDDIILTGSSTTQVEQFVDTLARRFSLKDLGSLSYFLGVEVLPHKHGILLSQRRYIMDLLARTKMTGAKPVQTPLPTSPPISLYSGTPLEDPTTYRTVVGSL
ncbi:hypothetical protein LWI29_022218 [Acer saccharum]|uniref:Reverse transcriptase Ty1/copia-type domain-containing protein n=1 Tax=Acer saccharum TaxID=4024 RepID=A0AA39TNP4_ACESA|nr:hypothetical protein LWI29_022218 [Acer saccharum]